MSIDIVFSLDQTGSMLPATFEAKRKIVETSKRLFKDIPDLRIGFIAHGDYCDYRDYVVQTLNPTSDPYVLKSFLKALYGVDGGDSPEAYEQVLHIAANTLPWRTEAHKILVVVGDEVPHEVGYRNSWNALPVCDWHLETKHLAEMGVIIHGVQCLGNRHAKMFYQTISKATGGSHLELSQFSNIVELIHAIAYQQSGQLDAYAAELQGKGLFNRGLAAIFEQLNGKPSAIGLKTYTPSHYHESSILDAVPPHRFQVLHVDDRCVIQDFVSRSGARYKKGRGFYQFTKPETIQHHKEIVLRDKRTGDMFTGRKARELAGIPEGVTARVKPHALDQYNIFVQSTSYTRVLMPDTLFLYEVEEWA